MKWRNIETEGLPKWGKEVLWCHKKGHYRIGKFLGDKVYLGTDSVWIPVSAFTNWRPLPKPPKE